MTLDEAVAIAEPIPGWCSDGELRWLGEQARKHKAIVEVGSWQGRSTKLLAAMTPGTVYAVDDFRGAGGAEADGWIGPGGFPLGVNETPHAELEQRFRSNLAEELETGKVRLVRKSSLDAIPEIDGADMVYIDGDHETDAVLDDIRAWREVLADGGLLCGHDGLDERVVAALRREVPDFTIAVDNIWRA